MHRIILLTILACCLPLSASGAEPVQHDVCRCCPAQPQPTQPRPGTWEPIDYPTPLRNLLFGSARFRPDPNFRWQPGQWVPIQPPTPPPPSPWQWQPGQWIPHEGVPQ